MGQSTAQESVTHLEQQRTELEGKLTCLVSQLAASLHNEDGDYEVVGRPSTTSTAPMEQFSKTLKGLCKTYEDQLRLLESENQLLHQRQNSTKDQVHAILDSLSDDSNTEELSLGQATKDPSSTNKYLHHPSNTLNEIEQTRSDLAALRTTMESLLAQDRKEMVKFFFRLDTKFDEQTARSKAMAKQDMTAQQDLVELLTTQHHELVKTQQRILWTVQNRRRSSRFWIVVRWIFRIFFYVSLLALIVYFGLIWDDSVNAFMCAPALPGTRLTAETGLLTPPFWLPHNSTLKSTVFRVLCTNVPRVKLQVRNQHLIVWRKKPYKIKKRSRSKVKTYPAIVAYVAQDMIYMSDIDGWHTEIALPWITTATTAKSDSTEEDDTGGVDTSPAEL